MNTLWRQIPKARSTICTLQRGILSRNTTNPGCRNVNTTLAAVKLYPATSYYTVNRNKSKKAKYDSDDDEDETEYGDSSLSRDSKVVKFNTTSMRTDMILKSALGIARNKIEQQFYESKIRVNGKKIMKKSASVKVGDEIDIVKTVSPKNPDHLYISRVEVINVAAKEDAIAVTARRFKSLLIENYEIDPYKGSADAES